MIQVEAAGPGESVAAPARRGGEAIGSPARGRGVWGIPPAILVAVAAARALAIIAQVTGKGILLNHGALIQGRPPLLRPPPLWLALLRFCLAWQVMVVAMMLPSALPMLRLFRAPSVKAPHSRAALQPRGPGDAAGRVRPPGPRGHRAGSPGIALADALVSVGRLGSGGRIICGSSLVSCG